MAHLKAYEWEREKFPWAREIQIPYEQRQAVTIELGKEFGLRTDAAHVHLRSHGGGIYHGYT